MPKVYLTKEDKREQEINTELQRMAAGHHKELAEVWGISQPGASYRIRHGNITLLDLYKAREIISLDLRKLHYLIGE